MTDLATAIQTSALESPWSILQPPEGWHVSSIYMRNIDDYRAILFSDHQTASGFGDTWIAALQDAIAVATEIGS